MRGVDDADDRRAFASSIRSIRPPTGVVLSLEELAGGSLVLLDAPPRGNYFLSCSGIVRLERNVRV
jgi:hypothetical protein